MNNLLVRKQNYKKSVSQSNFTNHRSHDPLKSVELYFPLKQKIMLLHHTFKILRYTLNLRATVKVNLACLTHLPRTAFKISCKTLE